MPLTVLEDLPADDPRTIAAAHYRRELLLIFAEAQKIAVIRDLKGAEKLNAWVTGCLVSMLMPVCAIMGDDVDRVMPSFHEALDVALGQAKLLANEVMSQ